MPLYELIMVCKLGEQASLAALLKSVSAAILQEGGIVRGFQSLGDRVLIKNIRSIDGSSHGVGRYMQVSPSTTFNLSRSSQV